MNAERLLNEKPSESEVQRVDDLWAMFNSTTQFLAALKQVMVNREIDSERAVLEQVLPIMAQVEANNLNTPIAQRDIPK
jgi:hypothetical protein